MLSLAEEMLAVIAGKGEMPIKEIQDRFSLSMETTNCFIDFLVDFGFAEFNEQRTHVALSQVYKKFLEEEWIETIQSLV